MKILFYSHTGKVSGAENILLLALKLLDRDRFEPVAICPEGKLAEEISELDIPVEIIGRLEARFTWRIDRAFKYLFSLFQTIRQLRSEILKAEPNLIHANSIRAGIAATFAGIGTRIPIFWHLQDKLKPHPFSTAIRLLAATSRRTRLIAASQATADGFRGRIFGRLGKDVPQRVIFNAVETEKFEFDSANRRKIRAELKLEESEFVLGVVGQITPRKGQLELVRAFAKASERLPSATLLIVGAPMFNQDQTYLEEIQQTVSDLNLEEKVKFLGLRSDVPAIMQSLDALVVNSKSEALVVVAIEAMACGTPVIATDVGGSREMIEDQKNGWLIPFGDEKRLLEALVEAGQSAEKRAAFSEAGKRVVAERLDAGKFIRDLEEFFEHSAPEAKVRRTMLIAEN